MAQFSSKLIVASKSIANRKEQIISRENKTAKHEYTERFSLTFQSTGVMLEQCFSLLLLSPLFAVQLYSLILLSTKFISTKIHKLHAFSR